jgi:hypothetical protein
MRTSEVFVRSEIAIVKGELPSLVVGVVTEVQSMRRHIFYGHATLALTLACDYQKEEQYGYTIVYI